MTSTDTRAGTPAPPTPAGEKIVITTAPYTHTATTRARLLTTGHGPKSAEYITDADLTDIGRTLLALRPRVQPPRRHGEGGGVTVDWRDIHVPDTATLAAELEAGGLSPRMARQAATREAHTAAFAREELFLSQTQGAGPVSLGAAAWLAANGHGEG